MIKKLIKHKTIKTKKQMQLKDLKNYAQQTILEHQHKQTGSYNREANLSDLDWSSTPEGEESWKEIYQNNNYTPFVLFHNISLEELEMTPDQVKQKREEGANFKEFAFLFKEGHETKTGFSLDNHFYVVKHRDSEGAKKVFHKNRKRFMNTTVKIQPILKEDVPEGAIELTPEVLRPQMGLAAKYVYSDKILEALDVAFNSNKNLICYGPGGHGKSEISVDFLKEKGIENPYIMTLGSGTTEDRLFGGIDIQKLNDTGKIEYLVENSFMNHEYVIFEEFFDAQPYILEQLKDILSSGVFRSGGQQFEIKTKLIIGNTNRTREEFAKKDASLRALLERFPLSLEVKWENYTKYNFIELFEVTKGHDIPMLSYLLGEFGKEDIYISPRIALTAADLIEECGPECLDFIAEFIDNKDIMKQSLVKYKSFEKIHKKGLELAEVRQKLVDFGKPEELKTIDDIKAFSIVNTELKKKIKELEGITTDDSLVSEKTSTIAGFNKLYNQNKEIIENFKKTLTV